MKHSLKMVKADASGMSGYSMVELFMNLLKWSSYVKFEIIPVLTVDQLIEGIRKAVQK